MSVDDAHGGFDGDPTSPRDGGSNPPCGLWPASAMTTAATPQSRRAESGPVPRWQTWVCFVLMVAACYAVAGPRVQPSQWMITADNSAPFREALAWHNGRLDLADQGADPLSDRLHDTAYVAETGKVYSVTPPLLTMICCAAALIDQVALGDETPSSVIGPLLFAPVVLGPLLATAFWAFRTQTPDPRWAAFLAFAFVAATANYPLAAWSQGGNAGTVNHLLSQTGLLLIAGDLLGRRRMWPAAIGLVIAVWSRQMTVFYALPMIAVAATSTHRKRLLPIALVGIVVTVGTILALNHLKFGSPFETGYRLIYEGRNDDLAMRAAHGLFRPEWAVDNVVYLIWRLPRMDFTHLGLSVSGHEDGNSLLFSMPIVILVFVGWRVWWADRRRRWLMLATVPVLLGILMYHAPGFRSNGCYRFGMDYVPIWLMAAAPALVAPKLRWWTLGCVAWSVVYFQMLALN